VWKLRSARASCEEIVILSRLNTLSLKKSGVSRQLFTLPWSAVIAHDHFLISASTKMPLTAGVDKYKIMSIA